MLVCRIVAVGQAQHVDGIIAIVGDKIILRSELELEKTQILQSGAVVDTQAIVCALLRKQITKRLMLNQAEIDSVVITDERVDAEIENRLRNYIQQAGSEAELEKYIGKSLAEYREEIRPKMKEQLLIQEMESKITANIKISPQEVKKFFDTIPADSIPVIPTEVEVAQLIIEAPISQAAKDYARMQLEALRKRILAGENFEKLAVAYSQDPGSGEQGGLLPEFGRGDMVPEFEREAFKLKPDSLSEVFESGFGFHLIKMVKRKGEKIIAKHILIRPQNTSADYIVASRRADSIYQAVASGLMPWCDAVRKYLPKAYGDKGSCGFLKDENTGSQKIIFEALSPELKQIVEKMPPGTFSKPAAIKTPDDRTVYRIVYLKTFIAPHQANLSQDYGRIQIEAESVKKQQAIEAWAVKTRKTTYIRINRDFVNCPDLYLWENQN